MIAQQTIEHRLFIIETLNVLILFRHFVGDFANIKHMVSEEILLDLTVSIL